MVRVEQQHPVSQVDRPGSALPSGPTPMSSVSAGSTARTRIELSFRICAVTSSIFAVHSGRVIKRAGDGGWPKSVPWSTRRLATSKVQDDTLQPNRLTLSASSSRRPEVNGGFPPNRPRRRFPRLRRAGERCRKGDGHPDRRRARGSGAAGVSEAAEAACTVNPGRVAPGRSP